MNDDTSVIEAATARDSAEPKAGRADRSQRRCCRYRQQGGAVAQAVAQGGEKEEARLRWHAGSEGEGLAEP
jgi:hypothetical protein